MIALGIHSSGPTCRFGPSPDPSTPTAGAAEAVDPPGDVPAPRLHIRFLAGACRSATRSRRIACFSLAPARPGCAALARRTGNHFGFETDGVLVGIGEIDGCDRQDARIEQRPGTLGAEVLG